MDSFKVELNTYPLEAVQETVCALSGSVRIKERSGNAILLDIKTQDSKKAITKEEFFNELLHQTLRLRISKQNSNIRERIVVQALASASRQSVNAATKQEKDASSIALEQEIEKLIKEAEEGSYKTDPLQIAVPWEKTSAVCKKGKGSKSRAGSKNKK